MKISTKKIVLHQSNELHRVERFVEDICDYNNVTDEHFGNIILAVTEAVEISFSMFGYESSFDLEIIFEKIPKGLKFILKEMGNNGIKETEEDILDKVIRSHKLGRELYIIRSLTDELEIYKSAKGFSMIFYVTNIDPDKSLQRVQHLRNFWGKELNVIKH